jgi:UDP-glucose 4-epimerase
MDATGTDKLAGKRVLITGGLGFIGSTLAHRLVEQQAQVTLVDSLIPKYGGNRFNITDIEDRVRVNISDVRDEHSLRFLVQGEDYLFNLAGQTSHLDSMRDPFTDLEINCHAQLSILETCRKYNPAIRVVFASTRQMYGKPDYLPVDEKHLLRPVDVNGINKMAGEWYHILYNNVYGIRACALRLTNTYGPRMRVKDARQTFLGVWLRLIVEGKPFEVWEGQQLRDFTYVEDAVDALMQCALSEKTAGQIYNVGGEHPYSLHEVAQLLVDVNGGGKFITKTYPSEAKRIDIGDYHCDWQRLRGAVGWEPKVHLRDGLARTLAYYRQNLASYL